jgi:hypothetical protein
MRRIPTLHLCLGLLLCAVAGPAAGQGASLEERYIAAREKAAARFAKVRAIDARITAEEERARVRFAEIPLGAGRSAYAMLANRTQDKTPTEADEVFVAALRGDRPFVTYAELRPPLAVAACSEVRAPQPRRSSTKRRRSRSAEQRSARLSRASPSRRISCAALPGACHESRDSRRR